MIPSPISRLDVGHASVEWVGDRIGPRIASESSPGRMRSRKWISSSAFPSSVRPPSSPYPHVSHSHADPAARLREQSAAPPRSSPRATRRPASVPAATTVCLPSYVLDRSLLTTHPASVLSAKSRTWFELCFIPLIPMRAQHIWVCGICQWSVPLQPGPPCARSWEPVVPNAGYVHPNAGGGGSRGGPGPGNPWAQAQGGFQPGYQPAYFPNQPPPPK
ncbi:hypothetical protein EVG20_g5736 [Dentipellis fragilis]|uniref:Uncharacterized protein n=1 Tax=Dentipellis fragilis TaxID=205917 RepID=A0A4Y9YTK2_9AGAM|nr:hypothetical protein EVG20_g5736 [Dentipellis fragilis]